MTQHVADVVTPLARADVDFRFAAAVASFGLKLRGSRVGPELAYDDILALGKSGLGDDEHGIRAEFLGLVRRAEGLEVRH